MFNVTNYMDIMDVGDRLMIKLLGYTLTGKVKSSILTILLLSNTYGLLLESSQHYSTTVSQMIS